MRYDSTDQMYVGVQRIWEIHTKVENNTFNNRTAAAGSCLNLPDSECD